MYTSIGVSPVSGARVVLAAFLIGGALLLAGKAGADMPVPSPEGRIDPGGLPLPKQPATLTIHGVQLPSRAVARGNSTLDLTVNVTVRNAGGQTGRYSLAAEIPDVTPSPTTGQLSVAPGATQRSPLRLYGEIGNVAFQGDQMPVVIRLLSPSGKELQRFRVSLPFQATPGTGTTHRESAATVTTRTPNLAIVTASVGSEIRTANVGLLSGLPRGTRVLPVTITIRNTMQIGEIPGLLGRATPSESSRWGYPAELRFTLYQGTPESGLSIVSGGLPSGETFPIAGNFAGGESRTAEIRTRLGNGVRTGLWYTLRATIVSTADSRAQDNTFQVVFMYGNGDRLVAQRVVPAGTMSKRG